MSISFFKFSISRRKCTGIVVSSGIISISLDDYSETLLLDDGDDSSHPYGQFTHLAVLNSERIYFVGYHGFGTNTLYSFNPETSEIDTTLLENKDLADIALDPAGNLWVANATDNGLLIYDTVNNTELHGLISTELAPINIDFLTLSE